MTQASSINTNASFIWKVAELLRGDFKQHDYGSVILPFVILRRLDCVLEAGKDLVLSTAATLPEGTDDEARDMILGSVAGGGGQIYNASKFTFAQLRDQDPETLRDSLINYISGFNGRVRDIFLERFKVTEHLKSLEDAGSLWMFFDKFCQLDLHPDTVSNLEMGYLFEELIRQFSEMSNETAGEHFTPREAVQLLVDLLIGTDGEALAGRGVLRTVYDPACGTGGILSIAEETMRAKNPSLKVDLFGQELNPESYAICTSDMMVKGHDASRIGFGNTLTEDAHRGRKFHYMMSNPPYGVDWKKFKAKIETEKDELGFEGRFGAGTPRVSDGQLLFVQHMIAKMKDDEKGSRIGIVMNGSPLFTGGAASGESEIRRWMLERDLIEAIIALPTDIFYNTGIQTYIWILSNRKDETRRGKVQLLDASSERFWAPMRKNLGSKRRHIPEEARAEIVKIYGEFLNGKEGYGDVSKIFDTTEFGYREIRVDRPLRLKIEITMGKFLEIIENIPANPTSTGPFVEFVRNKTLKKFKVGDEEFQTFCGWLSNSIGRSWMDREEFIAEIKDHFAEAKVKVSAATITALVGHFGESDENAEICLDKKGNPEPDPKLRDHELVPLKEDWQDYFAREVEPFVPDAWVDTSYTDAKDGEVGRVGYEINFNRYFYQYVPPRPLAEIDAELKMLEAEIAGLLKEVVV